MKMETEQNRTLAALQFAIQMEIDGKEYYKKVSQSSSNRLGRELFQSLAAEEDIHRQKFEEIYHAIGSKKAWPETDFQPDKGKRLRTIFAQATETVDSNIKVLATELDAVKTAMDMENKTNDYYKSQSQTVTYATERDFFELLAIEEREHYLVLLDYYEYLKDPAAWFVQKEHPSLDAG